MCGRSLFSKIRIPAYDLTQRQSEEMLPIEDYVRSGSHGLNPFRDEMRLLAQAQEIIAKTGKKIPGYLSIDKFVDQHKEMLYV